MSNPELPEVLCVTCKATNEVAQLLRRIDASEHEMKQLRAQMVELTQQMNHVINVKDAPPLLYSFQELDAMYAKFSVLVEEKVMEVKQLGEELQRLRK
ncbi:hypothetical protein EV361DRAFT_954644 [Lentinula raphanica]|uniref:Uncharacterized protein n=1 Tax=Lentinula raphanica TaxID=153919 RepID=A0AA38U4E3_9AGAR|nr:hypothetical protein F5878DRAFT_667590 [Lentinula raphanica]KAJ3965824.1 hypothetical protein EV361DRAFT_954644 [Lentinula raphanica]